MVAGSVALVSKVNGLYFPDEVSMNVDSYNSIGGPGMQINYVSA